MTWAARFGYGACGSVYAMIGIAAISVALGMASEPKGSHGVLRFFAALPFGPVALAGLGAGFAGYAALNFAGALNDPERRGVTAWGLVTRGADVLTGALYVLLAIAALALIIDPTQRADDMAARRVEEMLRTRSGTLAVTAAGALLILSGLYLFYRAAREPFGEMLDRRMLSPIARRGIAIAARAGTAARGVIFAICGAMLARAADGDASRTIGDVGAALSAVGGAAFGPILLALTGGGFVAYGGYQLAKARYQRITSPGTPERQ